MDKLVSTPNSQSTRIFYADVLRSMAIFFVIIVHCSSDYVSKYGEISAASWWTGTAFDAISRVCIPLFLMLSGAFLLKPGKKVTMKELFGKRLPKILIPLLFWSVIYVIWQTSFSEEGWKGFSWKETLHTFYEGPVVYHFWFLYMMVGIYLIYPIINAFIGMATATDLKYFLLVWFFANSVLFIIDKVSGWTLGFDLNGFIGYVGYFVLGYYLSTREYSSAAFKIFMACMILGLLASVCMPWILYHSNPDLVTDFTESDFTPDLVLASAGLFVVIKQVLQGIAPNKWLYKIINSISLDAFGIYLVHVLVLEYFFSEDRSYMDRLVESPGWGIPVRAIFTLAVSFVIVKGIRLVPILKKVIG